MNDSSRFACVDGFGEELDELIYEGISNWFITFRSPFTIYTAHFSLLLVFISIVGCGLLSYRHSIENGQKYTQFWWGALVHGVVSERGITAVKYWHAQAPIMFLGKQLPLHIVFLYPSIIYVSMMAVHRLKLNVCTEPAAVGLIAMLLEIPFRMISVKFLHITYHDTDPLYHHRLCGVPWIEIFSSLVFASSYVATYHGMGFFRTRDVTCIWDSSTCDKKDIVVAVLSGLSGPIAAFFQKVFLFHILHDVFNVNPISCMLFAVCLYMSFVLCFEPRRMEKPIVGDSTCKSFLFYQVSIYLSCLVYLSLFGKPQNEISIGSHEPTGDCTTLITSRTPLGKEIQRKKFLCTDDVRNRCHYLYNFDCLPSGPPCYNTIWYTICGTSFRNRINFTVIVVSCSLFAFAIFMRALFTKLLRFLMRIYFRRKSSGNRSQRNLIYQLKRKKYLCPDEIAARKSFVYNFDCLEDGPPLHTAIWYTICGSPIHNRPQFFLNLLSFLLLISSFFYKVLFKDVDKFQAAKRLIVKFIQRPRENGGPPESQVSVGFVIVKQDRPFLPKMMEQRKKTL